MRVKNNSDKKRFLMATHIGEGKQVFEPGEVKDLPDHIGESLVAGKNDIIEVKSTRKASAAKKTAKKVTTRSRAAGSKKATSKKSGGSRGSRRVSKKK